jgi:DNA topoisomerase I
MSYIVIVESPSKIKTISKYIGNDYIVMASVGHIMDLKENEMSIDLETFEPIYEEYKDKKEIITKLKNEIKKNKDNVILATDMDREGEMIAWSIQKLFKLKNPSRIVFSSITKNEILKSLKNAKHINDNLVNAQQARRILDRLTGYCISPILSKHCDGAKSAGRVQSVIVKLIVDKEKEINDFKIIKQSSYYIITSTVSINNYELTTKLTFVNLDTESNNSTQLSNDENKIIEIINKISISKLSLLSITNKYINTPPQEPFTTSTLQQQSSIKLKFNSKKTMTIAQKLYESGHITYMRTDSIVICKEALKNIEEYILETFGDKYYKKRLYENNKNSQEAHECIRPTNIDKINIGGTEEEQKLYNLIWKQTIQSQMSDCINQHIKIDISISKLKEYKLSGKIQILIFEGYLILDKKKSEEEIDYNIFKNKDIEYIDIKATENIKTSPERFNESSLIKKLDPKNLNIGRPSTYATLLNTITDRNYVIITNIKGDKYNLSTITKQKDTDIIKTNNTVLIGTENNKYVPTELGIKTVEFLEKNFSKIMDYNFTSELEKKLDEISVGKLTKIDVIKPFYEYIKKCSETFENSIGKLNNIDIFMKSGKYGDYITYNGKNYNCPTNIDKNKISEYLEEKIKSNKEWFIDKYKYILKNGEYGYYIEEYKNNKKTINIPMKFLIDKYKIEDIDNDILSKHIKNYKEYKKIS